MDYASLQTKAADLVANYGQAVTLTQHSSGSYDAGTSGVTLTETPTSCANTGVAIAATASMQRNRFIRGPPLAT